MEFNEIVKKIAFDKEYNPFNPSFSVSKLREELIAEASIDSIDILFFIMLTYFKDKSFINSLSKLKDSKLKLDSFYFYIFSYLNHESYLLEKQSNCKLEEIEQSVASTYDIDKIAIENSFDSFSYSACSDAIVEILDFDFSLLKCIKPNIKKIPKIDFSSEESKYAYYIFQKGQDLILLKDLYERICFERATIRKEDGKFIFNYFDNQYLISRQVGDFRIRNNLVQGLLTLQYVPQFDKWGSFSIKEVKISEKEGIIIDYGKHISEEEKNKISAFYNRIKTAITYYHYHLSMEFLSEIYKIAKIYSSIYYLLTKVKENELIVEDDAQKTFSNLLLKIKAKNLVKLIQNISGENNLSEIFSVISILQYGERKSFWDSPLFRVEDYFFIVDRALYYTNALHLIDDWLQICFPETFSKKGLMFEKLVKEEISKFEEENPTYISKVCKRNKIYPDGVNEYEEIDLIWETKTTVLLAEIKCIDYPFTHRNTERCIKIIEKASKQIIRKEKFLLKYKELISDISLDKKIQKCVIINYPSFSGLYFNNIPIIDIGMFMNYIHEGKSGLIKKESGCPEIIENEQLYYTDETEFSKNFEQLLHDSIFLKNFKQNYSIINHEISFFQKINISFPEVIHNDMNKFN